MPVLTFRRRCDSPEDRVDGQSADPPHGRAAYSTALSFPFKSNEFSGACFHLPPE